MKRRLIDPLKQLKSNKKDDGFSVESASMDEYGICPHCGKKMEEATCARKEVFLCAEDRIILPRVEEEQ